MELKKLCFVLSIAVAFGLTQDLGAVMPGTYDLQTTVTPPQYHTSVKGVDSDDKMATVVVGDFNGDRIKDIAFGAYLAESGGFPESGEVYIKFGKPKPDPEILLATQTDVLIRGRNQNNGYAGRRLAAGDINGDGIDDLLISAPGFDGALGPEQTEAYVVFGSPDLPSSINLAAAPVTITGPQAGVGIYMVSLLEGPIPYVYDINEDGFQDILLGFSRFDFLGRTDCGALFVIYGEAALPAVIDLDPATSTGIEDLIIVGANANDGIGFGITVGDFDGDGRANIATGGYTASGNHGVAYVLNRSTQEPTGKYLWGMVDQVQAVSGGDLTIQPNVNPGWIAGSLVNYWVDITTGTGAGQAKKITANDANTFTVGTPWTPAPDTTSRFRIRAVDTLQWSPLLSFQWRPFPDGWRFVGKTLAAGDINADGRDDLIVPAPRASPHSRTDAGQIFCFFGSSNFFTTRFTSPVYVGNSTISTIADLIIDGAALPSTSLGGISQYGSMIVTDVSGDGIKDLCFVKGSAGHSFVIFGRNAFPYKYFDTTLDPGAAPVLWDYYHQAPDVKILGPAQRSAGQQIIAGGDLNGDGKSQELLIADPLEGKYSGYGTSYLLMDTRVPVVNFIMEMDTNGDGTSDKDFHNYNRVNPDGTVGDQTGSDVKTH